MGAVTSTGPVSRTEPDARRQRLTALAAVGTPLSFLISLTVVLGSALTGRVLVTGASDLANVDLGMPLAWVHQDQRSLDPPFPAYVGLSSPWEHPTGVSPIAFLVDLLVVSAVVGVLLVVVTVLAVALLRGFRSARSRRQPGR